MTSDFYLTYLAANRVQQEDWVQVAHVTCPPIFKMATAERREARRRKLLRNPEDRLQRIIGSRSTHSTSSQSQLERDENASKSNSAKNDDVHGEKEVAGIDLKGREKVENVLKLEEQNTKMELPKGVCESKDLDAVGDVDIETKLSPLENESACQSTIKQSRKDASASLPKSTVDSVLCASQTEEHESSRSASKRWRVIFNVVLAFVLVSKWTYVNLEVLLSTDNKEDSGPGTSHKHLVHSESCIWPFLALQLFFVCVTSFQKASHSPFISMLTVALQLCGIPIQFTHKINFALTALLAALKDFAVFFFSSVVIHHVVEHCINSGLLKQVLENFE